MDYMISVIRTYQYYEEGVLEELPEEEVREIFEAVLDWIEE